MMEVSPSTGNVPVERERPRGEGRSPWKKERPQLGE